MLYGRLRLYHVLLNYKTDSEFLSSVIFISTNSKTDSAQSSSNKCKKLITKNLLTGRQLSEYYLKQLS